MSLMDFLAQPNMVNFFEYFYEGNLDKAFFHVIVTVRIIFIIAYIVKLYLSGVEKDLKAIRKEYDVLRLAFNQFKEKSSRD